MLPRLNAVEARIVGCLMEKSVVTPEQYPLTLNALTNACNQKSSREPVMALRRNDVQRAARELSRRNLVHIDENFKTGAEKYKQRLCNTTFNDFQFHPGQFAVVCLLLLRGAQTPGELRSRSGRLHRFADNAAVGNAVHDLVDTGDQALLVRLPRTPGRNQAELMHQLCGPIDTAAYAAKTGHNESDAATAARRIAELEQRIQALAAENARLRARLGEPG